MTTECSTDLFGFASVAGREVVAWFDGWAITSDAGALLLGAADGAIGLIRRLAACFHDERRQDLIEHEVVTLVGQRVFGIALGYEDLNDHDELRRDPMMAVLAGKLEARREDYAPVAGKSTLNRLELSRLQPTRYHKISHNPVAIKRLFVELFLEAHEQAPSEIILDLDATDDPVHGEQEGRFFHGYYDCYCYLTLRVLRAPPVGCQASVGGRRCGRGRSRGTGADCRADSPVLALRPHSGARRLRLRARRADGLVRGEQGRLPVGRAEESPPGRRNRGRACASRGEEPVERQAAAPLPGLQVANGTT